MTFSEVRNYTNANPVVLRDFKEMSLRLCFEKHISGQTDLLSSNSLIYK